MLAALLLLAAGQWTPAGLDDGPILTQPAMLRRGPSYAFFEAFPLSGAGTTTACSTTAPTGAKGEVLTFTRTGNATCSKRGLATTGIADGDLVVLSGNVARVEPDADGVLGLRVEGARTNSAQRSQEFDAASWAKAVDASGADVPVVTANAATAPDGTTTAERVQFGSCLTSGYISKLQQLISVVPSASVGTFYVKGNGQSGSLSLCSYVSSGACTQCAFGPDSWTRCASAHSTTAGNVYLSIGCTNSATYAGSAPAPAMDVYLWGAQLETGAYATSYIPTVAAAVTRNAEAASFTLPSAIGPSFSLGVSMWWPSSSVGAVTALQLGTGAPDLARIGRNTNTAATLLINATTTNPAVSAMGTTQQRGTLNDNAGTRTATWQGASVAAPASSMTGTTTALSIGALDGIVTKVCADPAAGRCTP